MPSVDNRVVRMEFDNAQFEARIKQTLASLSQLDKALKMEGASKGLNEVNEAASRVNFNPLNSAISGVGVAFAAMSTVAITALATVTHAAISAGANIVKALSLDPVLQGFQEYELNIGSIQTILANTRADGTGLNEVNDALQQLNDYSDKTIYNFAQMARNIGTFTAAGVDLQTSVDSIKGISNLAAISGSSAEQASTAMYQLSQAVSTGTLRLMDWNSVVNAGMGGEVFQKALFETGVAMGTIVDAPVGTTFEEWTSKGNSFRDSLESGWLTADVLTNTLRGFTGDMTEAQLAAIGYTDEQIASIMELGRIGVDAATQVRTLTGLFNTLKESVASGWSRSFSILLGDFNEATQLFTGLSNSIGGFFQRQADARNAVLQGWADLGGRAELLQGLEDGFHAIGAVLSQVGKAFRDVFPATTAERLFEITQAFSRFTASLKPSEQTMQNVKRIATGLFSALDLAWDVVREGIGFIKDLVIQLTGLGQGRYLEGASDILDFFTNLRESLDGGEAIGRFFDRLSEAAQKPIQFINNLREAVLDFFGALGSDVGDAAGGVSDRVSQRFEGLQTIFDRLGSLGDGIRSALEGIMTVLTTLGDAVVGWFEELGDKLREAMDPGEFDAILDALNVSLLGGIGLLIAKFLSGGLSVDFGDGLFSNISGAFEQLTGTLEAMQTSIRADALLKIAAAVGILAASMVALSLIDSAALTRALIAMAIGFTQLMASFAVLNAMDAGLLDGTKFAAISAGMILLSTAVLILSTAVAVLAQLGWEELAKGLLAVTVLLAGMSAAAVLLSKAAPSMVIAGVGLIAMAVALNLLAGAIILFANISWGDMLHGFVGIAGGLLILAGAMHLMPPGLALQGAGLILVAIALNILAEAVKSFAELDWGEMAKGMAGIAGGLLIIAAAMHLMPPSLPITAAGLILVGIALNIIAKAMQSFGGMDWGEIGRGLAAMAGALLILAVATNAMTGALVGAAAILVVSIALGILSAVLIKLAEVPFGDLLKALAGIAIALALFGVAAALLQPVIPALLGLGVALLAIGAAFALFGVGALLVAKAFETLARVGPEAADAIVAALQAIGRGIPAVVTGLAEGILDLIQIFADAAGPIAEALGVLLVHLLETIEEILPLVGDVMLALIETILEVITEAYPQIVEAGLGMILALLQGLEENIGPITEAAAGVITNFLNALAANLGSIIQAGVNLIVQFILGMQQGQAQIFAAVFSLVTSFISGLASLVGMIIQAGVDILINFLLGITNNMVKVTEAVGTMVITFIGAVANLASSIATAGTDALVDFLEGITNNLYKVTEAVGSVITTFITAVSNLAGDIIASGANAVINFIQGLGHHVGRIVTAGVDVVLRFLDGVASNALRLANAAADILITFLNALAETIREKSGELRAAGANIASAIIDGLTGGLASKARSVADSAISVAKGALSGVTGFLGISSPSKEFYIIGQQMAAGMALGLSRDTSAEKAAVDLANRSIKGVQFAVAKMTDELNSIDWTQPVITPVLDLTQVRDEMAVLNGMLPNDPNILAQNAFAFASNIARSPVPNAVVTDSDTAPNSGITFEQNIYSPEELSPAIIYKQTRNQITLAKEELRVP